MPEIRYLIFVRAGCHKNVFAQRSIQPEMLDHLPQEEARPNLADLVRINRHFGGHSVLRKALAQVVQPDEEFTVLDVGAASGDTARLVTQIFPRACVTNLDYSAVNLSAAPPPKILANAFQLPFQGGSFDFVLSSLFLHHFDNAQVVSLLKGFYALARRAIIVCDLERHLLPWLFLPATKYLLGWQKITVHDGIISVRASFRAHELTRLANQAGIVQPDVRIHRPAFRLSLVALKL